MGQIIGYILQEIYYRKLRLRENHFGGPSPRKNKSQKAFPIKQEFSEFIRAGVMF